MNQRALELASLNGNAETVREMCHNGAPAAWLGPALAAAVRNKHNEIVQILLSAGADPNEGELASPAGEGMVETVRLLLEAGADPDRPNENGFTPLGEAASKGIIIFGEEESKPEEVMRLLIDYGARVEDVVFEEGGSTALMMATSAGSAIGVRVLLGAHAEVNRTRDDNGEAALHMACAHAHLGAVEELLAGGADIHLADHSGDTPLHHAAGRSFCYIVGFANLDEPAGQRVLDELQLEGAKVVRLLLQRGANPEVRNQAGRKPVDIAQRLGYREIVQCFQGT